MGAEFLEHLPCLSQFEYKVMLHCQHETNQTLVATQALQKAAFNNNLVHLKSLLQSLCQFNPSLPLVSLEAKGWWQEHLPHHRVHDA